MRISVDLDPDFFSKDFDSDDGPVRRKALADRLTKLYVNLDHGSVAILDGKWGTGKTVFAKRLQEHLKRCEIPCIYFDAFSSDYIDSPFRAVATAFVRAAKDAREKDASTYDRFLHATSRVMKAVAAPAAKMTIKAVSLGLVGAAEVESLRDVVESVSSDIGDASEESIRAMLEEQADDESKFSAMRRSLNELPGLLSAKLNDKNIEESDGKLIVIIDELDRCRPDFALGIL